MSHQKWKIICAVGIVCIASGVYLLLRNLSGKESPPISTEGSSSRTQLQVDMLRDTPPNNDADVARVKLMTDHPSTAGHGKNSPAIIDAGLDTEEETARQEAIRRTTKASDDDSNANVEDLLKLLRLPSHRINDDIKKEIDEAIKELAELGDEVIPAIMAKFNRRGQKFVFRHRTVTVLEKMGSPMARENLLNIALGKTQAKLLSMKKWAAGAYIKVIDDRSEAKRLLASNESRVQNIGLTAMAGQKLEENTLKKLGELIDSQNRIVRWSTATVMAKEPSDKFAQEKIVLLVNAIQDSDQYPEDRSTHPTSIFTYAEVGRYNYTMALAGMKGALKPMRDSSDLAKTTEAKQAITIARAMQGDMTVKGDILRISTSRDSKNRLLRVLAIRSLEKIGTQGDIPLLRQIAEADPLVEERQMGFGPVRIRKFYPGREAASRAIKRIQNRQEK